ncbi:XP_036366768.1uncharacterized protein LOC118766974 [Octopus vulgaris]|uniref:XP_036366768.1uncharacterized protein LOC118766974 n=1 Tax=Octopus vulgaris TaxID=6645 RepID=A0AA36BP22_OCTVU|nr:XP_036366768.1uncharacterized protein LOC118766974 [Octopus vulgaris]
MSLSIIDEGMPLLVEPCFEVIFKSVDIVITPGEVRAGGKEKVKITCIDKKYATKVYAITISKDGRDIVTIEPPKKASWVDNDMSRRSYLINTHISAGNSIATLYVTIPRGWDTGIYRCTVQKTPRPETSRPMALKVNVHKGSFDYQLKISHFT